MAENRGESAQEATAANGTPNGAPVAAPPRNPKVQMPKVPFPSLKMPLNNEDICQILPHRYPFLLVDRILELEPGHRCVGIKNVTVNEQYFNGHFPGHPVMPGVLILEAMAQVAGILTLVSRNSPGALSYFAQIEKARFRQPVRPGDQLVTEAILHVLRGQLCKVHVTGRVDGQIMVEADYTFMTAEPSVSAAILDAKAAGTPAPAVQAPSAPVTAPANGGVEQTAAVSVADAVPVTNTAATPAAATPAAATNPSSNGAVTAPRVSTGKTFVHSSALVDPTAQIDEGAWIGPYCVIEGGTQIGAGTVLESNVVMKRGTTLGKRCRVWPHCILGHEPQDVKFLGEESFLRIGDDNILREMVTIHRATGEGAQTVIGNNNILMAYVHVGHNCVIGNNTMISNTTGIAGHITIEDKVVIGGFAGIHQFVHIGKMAMVGGLSKVVQDVPPFCIADGRPAKVHGLNIRGLRRNGIPPEQRNQVSTAFKLLYRTGLNTSQALERIHAEIPPSETLSYFIHFVERVREGRLGRQDETPHL